MKQALTHRYFSLKTTLSPNNSDSEEDPEVESPQRPQRYQRAAYLLNGFQDEEFQTQLQRQQD